MSEKYESTLYCTIPNRQAAGHKGPSTEKYLEICNEINVAIASDRIVMADDVRLTGAFPNSGGIYCIGQHNWTRERQAPVFWYENQNIRSFKAPETDTENIYTPCVSELALQDTNTSKRLVENTEISVERCLVICNAINAAVATERIVMANNIQMAGAFLKCGKLYLVGHFCWDYKDNAPVYQFKDHTIRTFHLAEMDVDIVHTALNQVT